MLTEVNCLPRVGGLGPDTRLKHTGSSQLSEFGLDPWEAASHPGLPFPNTACVLAQGGKGATWHPAG